VEFLRKKFGSDSRLQIVQADVLACDLAQWGPLTIAGNLPYYISSAILEKILAVRPLLRRAVLLVQKEVAERLVAAPGTRAYGYMTIVVALHTDARLLFEVKPSAFHPPPKVDSAVVRLVPSNRAQELGIADPERFLEFVARAFHHKRKTLRNNLAPFYGNDVVAAWPEASLRAEQVPIEVFARMYERLVS
jgi:16S rRNA (adenine1518-N6/adenine1519-N6)-dimethyltransferase